MADALDRADLRARVQAGLDDFLQGQADRMAEVGPEVGHLVEPVATLLRGGKRLRAGFLYWGYRAAGGADSDALVRMASSMELFQAAALIHDDVMDRSDVRRGMPAAHVRAASLHAANGWSGESARFGDATAILAGDLCLVWTDELYATCGLPESEIARGRGVFDTMRTQLMGGQFLDVLVSARGWDGLSLEQRVDSARQVIRYKSAKYSIEHPLLIGASVGGLGELALRGFSSYGLDVGEAFQLRDDLLGVFGDPAATGKPAGDDLREGKLTVLVAHALAGSDASQCAELLEGLGDPQLEDARIDRLRGIIRESGAVARVEEMIEGLAESARTCLHGVAGLDVEARTVLDELVDLATARIH